MDYSTTTVTKAGSDRVWAALTDVERWPELMSSYTTVQRLDAGPLTLGSRARVKQPGLVAAVYEVIELTPGKEFTWTSQAAGVSTSARHTVVPEGGGGTRITLSVEQKGALAALVALLLGRRIRRYLEIEARGLRVASEDVPGPEAT